MRVYLTLLLMLFCLTSTQAQLGVQTFQQSRTAKVMAGYQYWSAGDDQIQQFSVPVTFAWAVNENLRLDMTTTPAFSSYASYTNYDLGGLSDTRLRGAYLLDNENILITFGVNLPTGKSTLNSDELQVASYLSSYHVFNFQMPILGQGLDFSTGFVMAKEMRDMILGFGAGFLLRGSYDPYMDYNLHYNPGEEFSISGGIDYFVARDTKLMADLSYTIYGEDKVGDIPVFKSGNRLNLQVIWSIDREPISWLFMARNRMQGKNKSGSGDLVPERMNSNGNEFDLTGIGQMTWDPKTRLRGVAEFRLYSNNANDQGGATVFGLGGGMDRRLGKALFLDMDLRFYFGSINSGVENTGLTGFQLLTGLKVYL